MEETQRMWIKALLTVLCVLILTIGACESHTVHQKARMVIATGDPMAGRCALGSTEGAICAVYAVERD